MRREILGLFLILASLASHALADDCRHRDDRRARLDARGADVLEIEASAGFLVVEGEAGLEEVEVDGRACSDDADRLPDIRLVAERRGRRLEVRAELPRSSGWGWRDHEDRLDLTLRVPSDLALDIDDGSGSVELRDVGDVELEDGSGEVVVIAAGGDLWIDDGSGEVRVEDAAGDVRIRDGSGSIRIRGVEGTVHVDDGSGEIDIARVGRNVEIDDDGSGSIYIRDVDGDVVIGSDGSGSIDVESVRGDFEVRSDGSGGIRYRDIDGRVRVPRGD